jgi:hypothetical protein
VATKKTFLTVRWQAPSYPTHTALDVVYPGFLFAGSTVDSRIDRYEVQQYEEALNSYMNLGYVYEPQVRFRVRDDVIANIRIRAILRDETKTKWAVSGTFSLYGFTADFSDPNNILFLGII